MDVLVTGATGFLGSHVVQALLGSGHSVRALVRSGRPRAHVEALGAACVEGDLRHESSLHQACRGVEGLVHAAGSTSLWSRRNAEQWRVNVDGTAALLRAAHATKVARIVHVSTAGVVGATRDGSVLDETARWMGPVHGLHYLTTKKEAEERAFAAAWAGIPVVIVNPSVLLGPRLDARPPSSLFVRVASGRVRFAPPGGLSFGDVDDVSTSIVSALERGQVGERYLLAGHNLTWREWYDAIAREAGAPPVRVSVPSALLRPLDLCATLLDSVRLSRPPWAPEIFRSWGWTAYYDSSKAQSALGYRIRPLEETLRRTLNAWRAHQASSSAARTASSAPSTPDGDRAR